MPPPADDPQPQSKDTDSAHNSRPFDNTGNSKDDVTVEGGLDWFDSLNQSVSPDGMAPPITTSTQVNLKNSETKERNRQPRTNEISNNESALNCDSELHRLTPENTSDKNSTGSRSAAPEKKTADPESSEFVLQKVSKNLRDRRLKEVSHLHQGPDAGGGDTGGSVNKTATNTTSESQRRTSVSPDNSRPVKTTPQEKEEGGDRALKNISAALAAKKAAEKEPGEELRSKFSKFIFKPRNIRSLTHRDESSIRGGILDERNQERGDVCSEQVSTTGEMRPVCQDSTGNKRQSLTEGEDKQVICEREESFCSRELDGNEAVLRRTKRTPDNKSTVASSTLAKLSRFSFSSTSESTNSAQTEKVQNQTDNSVRNKTKPVNVADKIKSLLNQGQKLSKGTESLNERSPGSKTLKEGHVDSQSSVGVRKRKCFELDRAPSSTGAFSLFSSVDLGNDVLDIDWDQEVSKKPKI